MNRLHRAIAVVLVGAVGGSGLVTTVAAFTNGPDLVAVADTPAVRLTAVPVADPPPPPAPAPSPPSSPPAPPAPTSPAEEVVALTNQARAAAGVPPLDIDAAAAQAALAHSADQAAMRRMSHTGSDGSNAGARLDRAGYRWRAWGENVAAGQRTAAEVTGDWLDSPGHRSNMLNATYVHIGVGVAYDSDGMPYWTMVLAAPR